MDNTRSTTEIGFFALADEILIQILESLRVRDILACSSVSLIVIYSLYLPFDASQVSSRFNAIAKSACVPFRNALARYDLQYSPPYQVGENEPCLAELLYTLLELQRRWLVLSPTKTENVVIADPPDDILFYEQFAVVDRQPEEDDDEPLEASWELEVLTFGETSNNEKGDTDSNENVTGEDGEGVLEVDVDGGVIEEIMDTTGIDLDAVETEDVDDNGEPVEEDDSEEDGAEVIVLENKGVYSIAEFKTANSNLCMYKVDTRQDLRGVEKSEGQEIRAIRPKRRSELRSRYKDSPLLDTLRAETTRQHCRPPGSDQRPFTLCREQGASRGPNRPCNPGTSVSFYGSPYPQRQSRNH